jgi:hypothetical protein
MTLLTGETDVFSAAVQSTGCAVMFLAKWQAEDRGACVAERAGVLAVLDALRAEGWLLSIRAMFAPGGVNEPMALDAGFAHAVDIAGVFEAPSLSAALEGTVRLEKAGWARLFTTEWLIGPREFAVVEGAGGDIARPWGFLALWEWNDAWSAADAATRTDYDAECDVAFKGDLGFKINIAGRHRLDWAHGWHHLGAWEAPSAEAIDAAITGHEDASDFMFTTSRHFIGPVRPLRDLLDKS